MSNKPRAAALKEKIAAFEAQPQGEPSLVVLEKMRLEISESKEELERVVKNSRDAILEKDREIEALNSRFRDLSLLYSEARKRIEGFEEEKQEYVSHLEEQKLKERIELENIANALRLSEASDLRNRIKVLLFAGPMGAMGATGAAGAMRTWGSAAERGDCEECEGQGIRWDPRQRTSEGSGIGM